MLPLMKERGWTALQAVVAVGGFTQFAARGRSHLLREDKTGRVTIPLDFNDLMRAGKDVPLNPGDIIVVPQSVF
jgi:hypothetical protein